MMCYYLNVQFQGQRVNSHKISTYLVVSRILRQAINQIWSGLRTLLWLILTTYRGVDMSLARPGNKEETLTFTSHSKTIQKVVRPTTSPGQQWPPLRTKNGDLSIVFSVRSA